jgi:hypothetical protein
MSYDLYSIDASTNVQTAIFDINQESNPWIYHSLGTKINLTPLTAIYYTGLTDEQVGLSGIYNNVAYAHNAVSVDLSPIKSSFTPYHNITFHTTYQCGNDNLMGAAIPEPSTVLLLGSGLIGFGVIARMRRKRS